MRKVDANGVAALPALPGSYLLVFEIDQPITVTVGRFGPLTFAPGQWLYAGSAWGPGGVRARLARHFRQDKQAHWHIDALSLLCQPSLAYVELQPDRSVRLECQWIRQLLALPTVTAPHPAFGSSDCKAGCLAHLVYNEIGLDWMSILQDADDGMMG